MSEFHPDSGLNKQDYYKIAKHQINSHFDEKLQKKSRFNPSENIEAQRNAALKKLDTKFFGRSGGGFVE
tara:strand:- start:257 stop:463 length:207 start_codon:yes stop_codon:yes gene_type:complete